MWTEGRTDVRSGQKIAEFWALLLVAEFGVALCKYFIQSWDIKFIFVDRKEKRIEEEEEYWLWPPNSYYWLSVWRRRVAVTNGQHYTCSQSHAVMKKRRGCLCWRHQNIPTGRWHQLRLIFEYVMRSTKQDGKQVRRLLPCAKMW